MDISIIIPTFNEAENIPILINRLQEVLLRMDYEVIVVDDNSPDGTAAVVKDLAKGAKNISCIERVGRKGLSSAVIEGIRSSKGEFLVIMDADLQHDERIIPEMFNVCSRDTLDLVVGSRYAAGGDVGQFGKFRSRISSMATALSSKVIGVKIKDPLSGFFIVRKSFVLPLLEKLSGKGFKILLDIVLTAEKAPKIEEVPFVFGVRNAGKSKLSPVVALEFLILLIEKKFLIPLPLDFVSYMLVGLFGVLVHLAVLSLSLWVFALEFGPAQFFATLSAIASNFFLNNRYTFFQKSIVGRKMIRALFHFYFLCLIGLMINLAISSNIYAYGWPWYLAGFVGTLISAFWNYMSSKLVVWR